MKVRTRFAPSPTGFLHVGSLRTALYEFLIARHFGGDFILRIEDTDQKRYVPGAVEAIYRALRVAGLNHDEGPDIGGPVGPYVQSQRKDIYKKYALELVEKGKAYYCFCSKERLDHLRQGNEGAKYDKHCLSLSKEEVAKQLAAGASWVIRQNIPQQGTTSFHCEVYGEITVENASLDDQVLIKSDGMPTYNFANVVDDHLMGITHVVRGAEFLSSCPKHVLLYHAFGWQPPIYVHLPLIVKEGGKKLSKREGDAYFEDFLNKGCLPEALINYVALLGWNPGDNREFFTLNELIEAFDIGHISKSPSVFDPVKLWWMNGVYIRNLSPEAFYRHAQKWFEKAGVSHMDTHCLARLLQPRIDVFSQIPDMVDFLVTMPAYSTDLYVHKKMKTDEQTAKEVLLMLHPVIEKQTCFTEQALHDTLTDFIAQTGKKTGQVLYPLRVALSGKQSTPCGAIEMMYLLGKEESLKRLALAIAKLS